MDAMREAEIEDIKSDVARLAKAAKTDAGTDPLAQVKAELTSVLEAADKPATHSVDGNLTTAGPGEANSSLNPVAPPLLLKALDEESKTGTAATSQEQPVARAVDAEMRTLAEALAVEIGEAAPRHANAAGATTHEKV
jgi:sec-independent protein translocase protein TatB